jgi:hypothetical protein
VQHEHINVWPTEKPLFGEHLMIGGSADRASE